MLAYRELGEQMYIEANPTTAQAKPSSFIIVPWMRGPGPQEL